MTVVGGDERAAGTVTLKNLQTGEQTVVPRPDVAARLAGLCTQT